MNFCTLKEYIYFIFIKVPAEYKEEFRQENNSLNISRIRNISLVIIVISAITGIFLYFYEKINLVIPTPHAITMHMVLVAFVSVFFVVTSKIEREKQYNSKFAYIVEKLFPLSCLVWTMVFSINAQSTSGQITVYVLGITLIAAPIYIEPIVMAIVYLSVNSAFFVILPYFQESRTLVVSHKINSVYLIGVAWFISRLLYQNRLNDFMQKKMIQEKNAELSKLNKKLEQLSSTDSLTGIYNRREFEKIMQSEWDNSICEKSYLSVALIDIDFFKSYNDTYGHIAGDDCIKMVVNTISSSLKRPTDSIARFGGEEFIVILPNTNQHEASNFCEGIREAVEALHLPHPNSPIACVTVSVGVCTMFPTQNYSCKFLVNNADKALYHAKYDGRNKIYSTMVRPSDGEIVKYNFRDETV